MYDNIHSETLCEFKESCTMGYEGFYTQSSNMASKYYNFVTLNKIYINFGQSAQL